MCQFVESIRIENGLVQALDLHNDRMNRTRTHFWKDCLYLDIRNYLTAIPVQGLFKCRVVYEREILKVEYIPYSMRPVHSLKLVEDNEIDYQYKSTDRSNFNRLNDQRGDADDILILKNGYLTDTSIGNIALFDGTSWITPEKPLLEGVQRRKLLEANLLKLGNITKESLWSFQKLRIFNAMIDFGALEIPINKQYIIK